MANSNSTMIHKLQTVLNNNGMRILYSTSQFYSDKQKRPVTKYTIKTAVFDEDTQRNKNEELFSSYSQIQIVLFLRDLWFNLQGKPIPTDNEEWNKAKAEYYDRKAEKLGNKLK